MVHSPPGLGHLFFVDMTAYNRVRSVVRPIGKEISQGSDRSWTNSSSSPALSPASVVDRMMPTGNRLLSTLGMRDGTSIIRAPFHDSISWRAWVRRRDAGQVIPCCWLWALPCGVMDALSLQYHCQYVSGPLPARPALPSLPCFDSFHPHAAGGSLPSSRVRKSNLAYIPGSFLLRMSISGVVLI